jgi:hypothetical protein
VRFAHRSFSEGAVAQSVEQRTENPCVAGSIPAHTTKTKIKPTPVVGFSFYFVEPFWWNIEKNLLCFLNEKFSY